MSEFVAETHQGAITIVRNSPKKTYKITMSPSEAEKSTRLMGILLSMVDLEAVPNHIADDPFVIRIFPKRTYALERRDNDGSVPFRLHEADELITTIQQGLGMCLNEQTLGRVVPAGTPTMPNLVSDEPI